MARSSGLETSWSQWRVYLAFVGASLLLLILEQARVGKILWDVARLSAVPGLAFVQNMDQAQRRSVRVFQWRTQVVGRLAELEYSWQQEVVNNAELTEQVASLQAQLPQSSAGTASLQSALRLDDWQHVSWEGVPGAWQIRAGCSQGLERGDPVITSRGVLVGVVSEVQRSYSFVDSWDSLEVRIPVRVGTPSAAAVVQGSPNGVRALHLSWPSEVANGDSVFTAGNQFIPRGLVVGSLLNLQSQEVFGEAQGDVAVPAQLSQIEMVLVPPKSEATCSQ